MKLTLPTESIGPLIIQAKEDNLHIRGLFIKYDIKIVGLAIELTAKPGYTESVQDAFLLGWYIKDYTQDI